MANRRKKNRLLDVFLSMQDDMKAVLDYFKIDYDKTELTARMHVTSINYNR